MKASAARVVSNRSPAWSVCARALAPLAGAVDVLLPSTGAVETLLLSVLNGVKRGAEWTARAALLAAHSCKDNCAFASVRFVFALVSVAMARWLSRLGRSVSLLLLLLGGGDAGRLGEMKALRPPPLSRV